MSDWPAKNPAEVEDFAFNFAAALQDGETIATRTVTVEGVTKDSDAIDGSLVRVWLSGGAEGTVATVECNITTSGGRTFDEVAVLPIGRCAISLADAKKHLRVLHDDEDAVIGAYLAAATDHVERVTGKYLRPTVARQVSHGFPCRGQIKLFKGPVRSISSVMYDDSNGVEQELADYRLSEGDPAIVMPLANQYFPVALASPGSVRISYLAGYAPEELPHGLKAATMIKLRQLYDGPDTGDGEEPRGFEALIRPYCAVGIG